MTSSRKIVKNPGAPAKKAKKPVGVRVKRADAQWALFPSADQLRQVASAVSMDASTQDVGRTADRLTSLDVPCALLNPLDSLPIPLSLDEIKVGIHAAADTRVARAT